MAFWRSVGAPPVSSLEVRIVAASAACVPRCYATSCVVLCVRRRFLSVDCSFTLVACVPFQALLSRPDCTLEALLYEDELLQELKALNNRLIELYAPRRPPGTLPQSRDAGELPTARGHTHRLRKPLRRRVPTAWLCRNTHIAPPHGHTTTPGSDSSPPPPMPPLA